MTPEKPRRLGRGLEALIGGASPSNPEPAAPATGPGNDLRRIPLAQIRPNPFQPRREFTEADLAELRASMKASGLLQPVLVRAVPGVSAFELISGERRFRAATDLGWNEIPAVVRAADERTMLTLALVENLQRADLNAVEEAHGYQRLQQEFQLTHQQIAEAVGKERSTVTNLLRLLVLPGPVLQLLESGALSMGHARALLALPNPEVSAALAGEIASAGMSVRETERRVRKLAAGGAAPAPPLGSSKGLAAPSLGASDPAVRHLEEQMRRRLQTDVRVRMVSAGKGVLEVSFYSNDDLTRVAELLLGEPRIGD